MENVFNMTLFSIVMIAICSYGIRECIDIYRNESFSRGDWLVILLICIMVVVFPTGIIAIGLIYDIYKMII